MPSLEDQNDMVPPATTSALRYELLAKCSVRMRPPAPERKKNLRTSLPSPIANESFTDDPRASSNAAPPTWPRAAADFHARGDAGFAQGLDAEAA
jgi:hypothetical protein